jgi:hypothetical protein
MDLRDRAQPTKSLCTRVKQILMFSRTSSLRLMKILRVTLAEVEKSADARKDDQALKQVRASLVRAMAELSIRRAPATAETGQSLVGAPAAQSID